MWRVVAGSVCAAAVALSGAWSGVPAADRAVVWVRTDDGDFERDLNREAARGLRLAAISDGLPCSVAALQAPENAGAPAAYRVVVDRDLAAGLGALTEQGFVPKGAARFAGTRHHVVFERTTPARPAGEWRLIEFEEIDKLEAALAPALEEGFQARLLVRPAFRSWPGLSERGMILAAKPPQGKTRDLRLVIGTKRNVEEPAKAVAAATADGYTLDLLFTSSRDGSRDLRRERLMAVMSREQGSAARGPAVTIERATSFGMVGSGPLAGSGAFWNDYLFAWTPAPRRQLWASPVRLSESEAKCAGIELRLRLDAPRDSVHSIVAAVATPMDTGKGFQLLIVTEDRLGF